MDFISWPVAQALVLLWVPLLLLGQSPWLLDEVVGPLVGGDVNVGLL
jgi:hypothetical protein